jgi:FkbH-like protein
LASLEQELVVEAVHPGSVGRAAQMCQRTNQFNLTTRRYTAGDIERMLTEAEAELYTLAVRDRFGDSGITGLAILRYEGDTAEIDTFLLSCRVLGRKVEDAFLAILVDRARENGARYVIGSYEPTVKNVQTAGFYSDRGFTSLGDGAFRLNIAAAHLPIPPYIKVEVATHA